MLIITNSRNLPSSLNLNSAGAVFGRIHRGPPGPDDDTGRASSAAKDRPMWFGWMDYERAARSGPAKGTTRSGGSGSRPVSRVLSRAVIHLRRTSPYACSDLPGSGAGHASSPTGDALPYLVLLRVGFTLPPVLPPARCALTAPFHPYPASSRTHTALLRGHIPRLLRGHEAVCFLWHFPWARAPQGLPGTLPFGARTFLRLEIRGSDCPVGSRSAQCDMRAPRYKATGTSAGRSRQARIRPRKRHDWMPRPLELPGNRIVNSCLGT